VRLTLSAFGSETNDGPSPLQAQNHAPAPKGLLCLAVSARACAPQKGPLMLSNLFGPLAMKLAAGLLLLALVFGGVQTWRLSSAKEALEDQRNALATERATHAVTRVSLETLESELAGFVKSGELRAERLAEAMEAQDEQSEALRAQAERIRAESGIQGDPCVTTDAVRGAGGL
jgi:hypothetical protein